MLICCIRVVQVRFLIRAEPPSTSLCNATTAPLYKKSPDIDVGHIIHRVALGPTAHLCVHLNILLSVLKYCIIDDPLDRGGL